MDGDELTETTIEDMEIHYAEETKALDVAIGHTLDFLVGFLQVGGALALAGGVAMVSLPVGIAVLGCLMLIFGIAIERGQRLPDAR